MKRAQGTVPCAISQKSRNSVAFEVNT